MRSTAPWRRRALLAALLAAAGVGGGVAAEAPGGRPQRRSEPVVLTLQPPALWPVPVSAGLWEVLQAALEPFLRAHPGVRVLPFPQQGSRAATIAAMLAGRGPDVCADWRLAAFVRHGLLLDLAPLLRRDGVDLGRFVPGQLAQLREVSGFSPSRPAALFALPAVLGTAAFAVNLTVLQQLRLPPPEPDWSWAQWARLWEASTVRPGRARRQRLGANVLGVGYDGGRGLIAPYHLWGYGGEYVDPRDPAHCFLDSPGSLACARAVFHLLEEGVLGTGGSFAAGSVVCTPRTCTCGSQLQEALGWRDLRWDYFAPPAWPVHRTTYASTHFFGIWAGTAHPELAWALLRWLALGTAFPRALMQTSLAGPNQRRLWPEWAATVRAVAPALADKNLEAFTAPVLRGDPYAGRLFPHAESQVRAIIAQGMSSVQTRRLTVEDAFRQMARAINALQRAHGRQAAQSLPHGGPLPPPSTAGLGSSARPAAALAVLQPEGQGVKLTAVGAGVRGRQDSMAFACQAVRSRQARFLCQLQALVRVGHLPLAPGAKVGLMARRDLTDASAEVFLALALGRGIHLQVRPLSSMALADQRPAGPQAASGLLGASVLLQPSAAPGGMLLRRPVWLRLDREGAVWQAFTSLDGKAWMPAGDPVGVAMEGCWVGLFATAHGGAELRAHFAHVQGFWPERTLAVDVP